MEKNAGHADGGVLVAECNTVEVQVNPGFSLRAEVARGGDRALWSAFAVLTITYVAAIAPSITEKMWFDELFTYYISGAPTLSRLMDALVHVDLNPPLSYLLVRLFHAVFGSSELVTRLPSALGFYAASMATLFFMRRRIGILWSTVAILLFWSTPYLRYATQARPYGLLLGFFSLTLISYDRVNSYGRNSWAVAGIWAGNIGMMLCHVFAPFSIFPFCVAEVVRCAQRRRPDWRVWMALLAPISIGALYIPAIRTFERIYFPDLYQASFLHAVYFFARLSIFYALPAIAAALLAFAVVPFSTARMRKIRVGSPDIAWAVSLLLVPVILNAVLARTQGAFWERYCITSALAFDLFAAAALARTTRFRRASGVVAALVLCGFIVARPYPPDHGIPDAAGLKSIRQNIPLVTASGLTFLEMDHYESEDFKSRLYYLVDREAAIQYAHSTIFENFPLLTHYFPIRAHVAVYSAFVRANPRFQVITRRAYREAWVLEKLRHDGARVTFNRLLRGPVGEAQLYDVESPETRIN